MNDYTGFSLKRLLLLIRRSVRLDVKIWVTGFAAIAGVCFLILLFFMIIKIYSNHTPEYVFSYSSLMGIGLFFYTLGGFLMTSRVFHELHNPGNGYILLTLPATSGEKFLSAWLITAPLYTIVAIALLFVFMVFGSVMNAWFLNTGFALAGPFDLQAVINKIVRYFGLQSIFLLGAVVFRKNNFIKTVLSIVVFQIVIAMVMGFILFLIVNIDPEIFPSSANNSAFENLSSIGSILTSGIWIIVALIFLPLGYVRLKHRQL